MGLELKGEQMEAAAVRFGTSFTYQLGSEESKRGITLTGKGTCAARKPLSSFAGGCLHCTPRHQVMGVSNHMETSLLLSNFHERLLFALSKQ